MVLSPEELAVFASLGGAVIGALPGIISLFINKRSEERKQFKELVVKAATESWKAHVEHAGNRGICPLEHYIIHTAKMCEFALSDNKITPETMKQHLENTEAIMKVLADHARNPSKQTPKAYGEH